MMREIKFRAWDGRTLSRPFLLSELKAEVWLEGDPDESCEVSLPDCALPLGDPSLVLDQWTGLCDKNGREIYEGDVVTTVGVGVFVRWDRGGFYPFVMVDNGDLNWFPEESKVIGNIHENSDLLNGNG